jgi:hypothetical protein
MDELILKAILYLFYGIYLAIRWLVLFLFRSVVRFVRWLGDQGSAQARPALPATLKASTATRGAPRPAAPAPPALAAVKHARALAELTAEAAVLAERCAGEEQNERFADTLSSYVVKRGERAAERLRASTPEALREAERTVAELSFVLGVISEMAEQRRDPDKLLLLGDADALAEACYRPLFEFARGSGVRLRSSRAATFLGDKDMAIFTGFIPAGLAPIILPSAWSTEIGWWPALAHEIGHDFHASVVGFDAELRRRTGLGASAGLPRPNARLTDADLQAAYAAWLAELFADAFGTLMLGAAFVTTMMWSFADAKEPQNVLVIRPAAAGTYEEHPPSHLRVVLACRLLAGIGFPREAAELEAEWRRRHGSPAHFFLPTRAGTWLRIAEAPYLAYGEAIVGTLYLEPFPSLGGIPLRSIPGLDLGPREHQAALDARDAYVAGREAETRDPRCLIAGAVLAWKDRPALSARVLGAARATIPSVGVSRRQLRLRAARAREGALDPSQTEVSLWREAFLLGEAFAPPRGSKLSRRL